MAEKRTFEVDFDNNFVKQLDGKHKIEKIPHRRAEMSCRVFKQNSSNMLCKSCRVLQLHGFPKKIYHSSFHGFFMLAANIVLVW